MPRTGSKYLRGVVAAAWGILSETPGLIQHNLGHAHGLSDPRLENVDSDPKRTAILRIREQIEAASHVTCFTIFRPSRERRMSAFTLRKSNKYEAKNEMQTAEAFSEFWIEEILFETRFLKAEIAGYFELPVVEPGEVEDFLICRRGKLDYVALQLSKLDTILENHLFSIVSKGELIKRSRVLDLTYGLENRNDNKSRIGETSALRAQEIGKNVLQRWHAQKSTSQQ
jgi:hypothetical protein